MYEIKEKYSLQFPKKIAVIVQKLKMNYGHGLNCIVSKKQPKQF